MFGECVNARKLHNMAKGLTASRLIQWISTIILPKTGYDRSNNLFYING
jgi:hypothetical protein